MDNSCSESATMARPAYGTGPARTRGRRSLEALGWGDGVWSAKETPWRAAFKLDVDPHRIGQSVLHATQNPIAQSSLRGFEAPTGTSPSRITICPSHASYQPLGKALRIGSGIDDPANALVLLAWDVVQGDGFTGHAQPPVRVRDGYRGARSRGSVKSCYRGATRPATFRPRPAKSRLLGVRV